MSGDKKVFKEGLIPDADHMPPRLVVAILSGTREAPNQFRLRGTQRRGPFRDFTFEFGFRYFMD